MLKFLFRQSKALAALSTLSLLAFALNQPLLALVVLFDMKMAEGRIRFSLPLLLLVNLGMVVFYFVSNFASEYFLDRFQARSQDVLNRGLYRALLQKRRPPEGLARIQAMYSNDIPLIVDSYLHGCISACYNVASFVAAASIVAGLNVYLLVYLAVASIGILLILKWIMKEMGRRQKEYSESLGDLVQKIAETIRNLPMIHVYHLQPRSLRKFEAASQASAEYRFRTGFQEDSIEVVNQSSATLIEIGLYIVGVILILRGHLTTGALLAVITSSQSVIHPIYGFSRMMGKFSRTRELRKDLLAVLEVQESTSNGVPVHSVQEIAFQGYQGAYDGIAVHQPVKLKLRAGEKLVLVGANGSGKSTLIQSLLGESDGFLGQLTINGTDVRKLDRETYWSRLSYVPQEVVLFEESLRENILLDAPYEEERYRKWIEILGLGHLEEQKVIQESQGNLSGGEKQKILLARALYRESDVLILDEPLSALDQATADRLLQVCLQEDPRTVVMIVHGMQPELEKRFDQVLQLERCMPG